MGCTSGFTSVVVTHRINPGPMHLRTEINACLWDSLREEWVPRHILGDTEEQHLQSIAIRCQRVHLLIERPRNATQIQKRTIMGISRSTSYALCLFSLIGSLKAQAPQAPLPTQSSTASDSLGTQSPEYQLAVKVSRVVLDVVVT